MNVCPVGAISMQPVGPLGHIHPVIDAGKCIDCHLCEKTCPVNHPKDLLIPIAAYAAVSRDYDDLMTSSSGGASSVMASKILKQGGIVYGCVQENYRDIRHQRIDSLTDIHKLKGSKYVQSNIGYIYKDVLADLKRGVPVLFSGTPCQISGLRAYLRKDYENLYLVDLVCHGVPSQQLLRENVATMLKRNDSDAYVHFRQKGVPLARTFGVFVNNAPHSTVAQQVFLNNDYISAFMNGLTFRDCCYNCRYAGSRRGSDITIADFWGLGKTTIKTDRGISLMLQNTEKGARLIEMASPACHMEQRSVEEAINGNGQLLAPFKAPVNRASFLSDYARFGARAYRKHLKQYRRSYVAAYLPAYYRRIGIWLSKLPWIHHVFPIVMGYLHARALAKKKKIYLS